MFCLPLVPAPAGGARWFSASCGRGPRPALVGSGGPRPFSPSPLPMVAPRHGGRGYGRAVSPYGGRFSRLPRWGSAPWAGCRLARPPASAFRVRPPLPCGRGAPPFPIPIAYAVLVLKYLGSPELIGISVRLPSCFDNNSGTLPAIFNHEWRMMG